MTISATIESRTFGQRISFSRLSENGAGEVLRLDVHQAAGKGVPVHVHPCQEERITVVAGEIELRIGRERRRLSAGDSATVPPNTAHAIHAPPGAEAHLVNEFRPPLRTEEAFARTFALEQTPRITQKLLELALIADDCPREFLMYAPVIPWQAQLATLRPLARLARRPHPERGDRLLAIYLNDQLAAGVLWRELARRTARENAGTDAGAAAGRVADAISEDVETFKQIMRRISVPISPVKPALAMAAERVGRLKPNGRLRGYSPLSRFVELDFLAMGIEGKRILWGNLRDLADLRARLPDVDFDGLIERAERQRAELEDLRVRAGRQAFGTS